MTVEKAVRKSRTVSAPGPNGVPYQLYKNPPDVVRFLWRLVRVVWKKKNIPKAWQRAEGVLISKEKNALNIDQFQHINPLNVEGNIFFSIVAQRMTTYLKNNNLIDSAESQYIRFLRYGHDMASDSGCKKGRKRCCIPRPGQCFWIYLTYCPLDGL